MLHTYMFSVDYLHNNMRMATQVTICDVLKFTNIDYISNLIATYNTEYSHMKEYLHEVPIDSKDLIMEGLDEYIRYLSKSQFTLMPSYKQCQ